ncbi:COP9 signalosome (CSN) subunit [Phlyctochytrium planicorne]|nr:COP9 signalosome (CSN) subunit [Phlyctochytrium planicorne]
MKKPKTPAAALNALVDRIQTALADEDGDTLGNLLRVNGAELAEQILDLKQINLATNLIKSIRNADLPEIEKYPIGHVVAFKYYMGVLAFFNEQYSKADEELTFALTHCRARGPSPNIYQTNRRLILNYLIPTRLISGKIPHPKLFKKHPILSSSYSRLIETITSGQLGQFDECLETQQRDLIARGTWLCKNKPTRLEFGAFVAAVHFAGCPDVDLDEVECMLANLIDKGYLKGYMSKEKLTLVLSPSNAFPSVSTVPI